MGRGAAFRSHRDNDMVIVQDKEAFAELAGISAFPLFGTDIVWIRLPAVLCQQLRFFGVSEDSCSEQLQFYATGDRDCEINTTNNTMT